MKRTLLLLLAAGTVLTAASFKATSPEKVNINVKDTKLMLGKTQVNLDWSLAPVTEYLGQQDRIANGTSNRAYVYDQAGISVIEAVVNNKPTGKITEIQVNLILPKSADANPKTIFKGTLKIEDLEMVKELSPDKVRAALSASWTETSAASSLTNCHFTKNGLFADFEFSGGGHSLRKVTIGVAN